MGFLGDRRLRRAGRDDELSVVDHLDELRNRLIVSGVTLVVAFGVAYFFHDQLITFLEKPLPERYQETGLITLSPTEPFFVTLKVCFWAAILASLPVWLYQLYAFVIPAVEDQSRRKIMAIVGSIAALFIAGVAFTFYVVLPVALQFLLNFGEDTFLTQVRAGDTPSGFERRSSSSTRRTTCGRRSARPRRCSPSSASTAAGAADAGAGRIPRADAIRDAVRRARTWSRSATGSRTSSSRGRKPCPGGRARATASSRRSAGSAVSSASHDDRASPGLALAGARQRARS